MDDQAERMALLQRNYGMLPVNVEKMNTFLDAQSDWYVFCRKCGKKRTGTKEALAKRCECHGTG